MNALRRLSRLHWQADIIFVAAFCIPLLSMTLPRFIAVVFSALGLLLFIGLRPRDRFLKAMSGVQIAVMTAMMVWMAASIAWTSFPMASATSTALRLTLTLLVGLIVLATVDGMDDRECRRTSKALAAGAVLALLVLLAINLMEGSGLLGDPQESFLFTRWLDRGATVMAILIWPACYALERLGPWRRAICLLLLAAMAIGVTHSLSAKVALLAGFGAAALTWRFPQKGALALGGLMVGLWLAMPLIGAAIPSPDVVSQWPGLTTSAHHRLTIWGHVSGLIEHSPWIGHGIESSRVFADKTTITAYLPDRSPAIEDLLPLHPHNAALQIYLELGAIGALLAAILIATVAWRISRSPADAKAKAAMAGVFAATYTIAMVSYGIWQTWWVSMIWLAAAFTAAALKRKAL